MASIIRQRNTTGANFKTFNFVAVGLGDTSEVKNMLAYLRKSLSDWCTDNHISLYSEYALSKAESNPELLQKKGSLSFRTTGNLDKIYIGFANVTDDCKLYSYLFDSYPNPLRKYRSIPYYSPSGLSEIIHNRFDSEDYDAADTFGDVAIHVTYTPLQDGRSYLKMEYRVNELIVGSDFERYLVWFDSLIYQMDADYSGCFQSAYISFSHPDMPIVHSRIYDHWDAECLDRYILGTEWRVYIGRSIVRRLDNSALESIKDTVSTSSLKSGIVYTANTDVASFDGALRKKICHALADILIPAYGIYNWRGLHEQLWSVSYLPQSIYVYRDKYDVISPTVVLTYTYPVETVQALHKLSGADVMGAWFLSKCC